jgi:DNA-binding NarL/FixJ family response regulator
MDIERLLEQQKQRRCWLLVKALECATLDRALDLARAAEEFVTSEALEERTGPPAAAVANAAIVQRSSEEGPPAKPNDATTDAPERRRLSLTPERRRVLLDRLAEGARNADLAVEFGLTPKQVQGLRIGAARAINARRAGNVAMAESQPATITSTVEDVVRYLRQQDDVVVSEGEGNFLVNGRFHLGLAELVEKANRIRGRQQKPLFKLHRYGDRLGAAATAMPPPSEGAGNGHQF